MVADCHPSQSSASQREEARRFLDDYDPLGNDSALENQKSTSGKGSDRPTPIPKAQLATLCAVRLVDPIAFTQIFPYVNEMMDHLHLTEDHSKIGFYSGLVESSFAIAQVISIYQWARLSDLIGRRPVVLFGIFGIGLSTLFLGVSTTLSGVILARCIGGLFSGNIAVIHSVLGEITDSSNQAIAFPLYGLCWPLGAIIGPLMGGLLSNPAPKFPQWFDSPFFRHYPYFLPCFAAAIIAFAGSAYGYFYMQESHPNLRNGKKESIPMTERRDGSFEKPSEPASVKHLLSIPVVRALCLSGAGLSFIATGFDVTFVLFCYTSIQQGGLAFNATQIGYALSISGLISILLQLFCMPFLLRRFDHARMYNFCMGLWPFCFVLLPGLNFLARWGAVDPLAGELAPATEALVWVGIAVILSISRTAALAFSVAMILVKDSAPNPASLGVTNGIAQFAMCLSRSFSPAFASSLLAFSIGYDFVLLRYLWVLVMTLICFLGTTLSRRIAEGRRLSPRS
ncbi:MFS general substrate transporter [Trametes coccinea BRFM310]|uniref:MFS general substrate transporter n=1 Tax=Trametes coccinea (strain BRFM310) TaxID=1353009 RepID=A0A1Y2ILY9_TRAC3|nr:MFS general substrate transporter [Trametes coccinea BRFM310]